MLTLADILEALTNIRPDRADQVITQAVIDSRLAIPGCLFIAIPGESVDGHDYVAQAFENEAGMALVEKDLSEDFQVLDLRAGFDPESLGQLSLPFVILVKNTIEALQQIAILWRGRMDCRLIGITGSVGKSTTKEMVAEVLSRRYRTLKNEGNYNNEIGLPMTLLSLTQGHERVVLEMGFYVPGEIKFLTEIALPVVGVVTNIGTVHAERAGTMETIAQGKAELVQSLPEDGWAILNYDDPLVRQMAEDTQAQVLFYGIDDSADLWADNIEGLGLDGIRFRLHYHNETLHMRVPMLGRHSVHTALRAAAVGLVEGLDWSEIVAGLRFGHMQLRLVAVKANNGALLLDDTYNASPQSTIAALNLLAEIKGHKVAVLGDMLELGKYEEQGHQKVGIRASQIVDQLIVIGKRAKTIAASAKESGLEEDKIIMLDSPKEAIAYLENNLGEEDVVLVKGSRGMQMEDIVPYLEMAA